MFLGQCDLVSGNFGLNPIYTLPTGLVEVIAEMDLNFTFPAELLFPTG
jgi:hypothetical protein